MNSPGRGTLETAVLLLLQPEIGYFSDHAIVTRAMPITIWRQRMQLGDQSLSCRQGNGAKVRSPAGWPHARTNRSWLGRNQGESPPATVFSILTESA
jgi:hypothetical protein